MGSQLKHVLWESSVKTFILGLQGTNFLYFFFSWAYFMQDLIQRTVYYNFLQYFSTANINLVIVFKSAQITNCTKPQLLRCQGV